MPEKFRRLTEKLLVAPQIEPADIAAAKEIGVTLVINNRPDDEEEGQPSAAEIGDAAKAQGLEYVHLPAPSAAAITKEQASIFETAVADAQGAVLAYCRSGTRSAVMHALGQAMKGAPVDDLLAEAAKAGYVIEPLRRRLESAGGS